MYLWSELENSKILKLLKGEFFTLAHSFIETTIKNPNFVGEVDRLI